MIQRMSDKTSAAAAVAAVVMLSGGAPVVQADDASATRVATVDAVDVNPAAGTPSVLPIEQIRARLAAAEQCRQELLRPDAAITDAAIRDELIGQWGVEPLGVRRSAGGYMIDFRFRVVDAEKALPLFDHRTKPYLLAQGSDIKLPVPVGAKVGAFRPTNRGKNIKAGKNYYMMFANPDAYLQVGQKVSVVIGEFRAEQMTLQ